MELTDQEKVKVTRLSGSIMSKLCIGGAYALKGVSFTSHKAASGIRAVANGIDFIGDKADQGAEVLESKAEEYDIRDIPDDVLVNALSGGLSE